MRQGHSFNYPYWKGAGCSRSSLVCAAVLWLTDLCESCSFITPDMMGCNTGGWEKQTLSSLRWSSSLHCSVWNRNACGVCMSSSHKKNSCKTCCLELQCVWVFLFFQLIKALKLKIQKLNETLLEANEGYRKMAEENSQLKHTIMLKVCKHFKSNLIWLLSINLLDVSVYLYM